MIHRRQISTTLTALATGIAFLGFGTTLFAQQLSVSGNAVTVSDPGAAFSPPPLSINASGIVADLLGVPNDANGLNVPTFTFTLVQSLVANGTYTFRGGFVLVDEGSNRRLEISIPQISMTFTGGVLSGSVSASQSVTVLGRNSDSSIQASATVSNNFASFSGTSLSFNADNQLALIVGGGGILADIINTIDSTASGNYSYAVLLKQTSGPATLAFGLNAGGAFSRFPCTDGTVFQLNGGSLAGSYVEAHGLQGQLKFVGSSGSLAAGDPALFTPVACAVAAGGTPTVTQQVTTAGTDTTDFVNSLSGTITANTVNEYASLITQTSTTVANTAAGIKAGTTTATTGLTLFTTLVTQLQASATITTGGQQVPINSVIEIITNMRGLIDAFRTITLSAGQRTQLRTLIGSTIFAITDFFNASRGLNGLLLDELSSSASAITLNTAIADVSAVIGNIQNAVNEALLLLESDINNALYVQIKDSSQAALELLLKPLGTQLGLNLTYQSESATRTLLAANTKLLERMLDNTAIDLGAGVSKVNGTALQSALTGVGFSTTAATALNSQLSAFIKIDALSLDTGSGSSTVSTRLTSLLAATSLTVNSTTGNVNYTVNGQNFSAMVKSVNPVSASIPSGTFTLDDGSLLVIGDGVAITLVSSVKDILAFLGAIQTVGGSAFTTSVSNDGVIKILELATNALFNASISSGASSPGTVGTGVIFEGPTGDPSANSYSFLVQFADGTRQSIVPVIADNAFYDSVANFGYSVSTNRSTGVIQIGEFRFRPDFAQTTSTQLDSVYRSFNADSSGVAYIAVQANGDSITDYKVITSTGTQIVYGLP